MNGRSAAGLRVELEAASQARHNGVAAAAAAGLLLTVTGTVGGLAFAAWAGADRAWIGRRRARRDRRIAAAQSGVN